MTVYAGHLEVMTISTLITVLVAGAVYEIYKRIAFVLILQIKAFSSQEVFEHLHAICT